MLEAGVYTSASDSALSFSVFKWPERERNQTHCFHVQGSAIQNTFISTKEKKKKSRSRIHFISFWFLRSVGVAVPPPPPPTTGPLADVLLGTTSQRCCKAKELHAPRHFLSFLLPYTHRQKHKSVTLTSKRNLEILHNGLIDSQLVVPQLHPSCVSQSPLGSSANQRALTAAALPLLS